MRFEREGLSSRYLNQAAVFTRRHRTRYWSGQRNGVLVIIYVQAGLTVSARRRSIPMIARGFMPENEKTMSQARQTLESIQSDFDRIALLSDESWNHNAHYHEYLMSHIPEQCGRILEIGCGTGEFSRLLARRAEKVLAIDLSPQMIRLAKAHSKLYPNIDFVTGDATTYDFPDDQFDFIATLTTLHHLPAASILRKIRKALKPGGVFVCLDLYQRSGLRDLFFDMAAYPANIFLTLIKTGKTGLSGEIYKAYAEHGKTDSYLTLPQIKQMCADILPGARVNRHLFWRYSIFWKKENEGEHKSHCLIS